MLTLLSFGLSSLAAQSPSLVDARDTTVLTPAQNALVYELMQQLPDGGEAGLALIDGDQTTFYGVRHDSGQLLTVNNADHHFGIGSVTKVFTATLLATLVQEGAVALEDPVPAAYDFPFADSITFTYRQLATHTSGLLRLPTNMLDALLHPEDPYSTYTPDKLETYLRDNLTVASGGSGGYSNLGFGLLGYTLGRHIDSVGYAAALHNRVLEPLGLRETHFGAASTTDLVPGLDTNGTAATFWSFTEALGGAGAIVSTPRDMARFLRSQLDTKKEALALTREEHVRTNERMSVGLGWQILQMNGGNTVYWHNGAVGGYRSFVAIDVENARGIVLLTNVFLMDDAVDRTGFQLLR